MYECIVFSDPRSTTKVQIATRNGEQTSTWLGNMKFTKLKIFNGLNRSPTSTFDITHYNTSDSIDQWLVPGIAVFVVRSDHLRFSGVISKVDGDYVGVDQQQIFHIMCESDFNWLLNRSSCVLSGTSYKSQTAKTILKDILNPDINWYNRTDAGAIALMDNTQLMDYKISDSPVLTQVQELATLSSMKYRGRTQSTNANISTWTSGSASNLTKVRDDDWITTTSTQIGKGTHNKWVCLYTGTIPAVCAVTASVANVSVTPTSTNAINFSQFSSGKNITLIQHPVLEFKPILETRSSGKIFYLNPTAASGQLTQSVCWDYNPLAEKNDVITEIIASANDCINRPISMTYAAAFPFDYTNRKVLMQNGLGERYHSSQAYDSYNLINTADFAKRKVQVFSDTGITWYDGMTGYITQANGAGYQEPFTVNTAGVTYSGELIGDRPTVWLTTTAPLTYDYTEGDIVSLSLGAYHYLYVNNTANFTAGAYYWVGRELMRCMSIASAGAPGTLNMFRSVSFVSSGDGSYLTRTYAAPHKQYCPITEGMPNAAESQKAFERDDYYGKGLTDTAYDAPIKKYGINARHLVVKKVKDAGQLELVCYNILRNSCLPRLKGNFSCFIDSLISTVSPYPCMRPGDTFTINYFGTVQPATGSFVIQSIDYDFDSGTCVVQFNEYDITVMMTIATMGLEINLY